MGLAVGISLAGLVAAAVALDVDRAPPAAPFQPLRVVVRTADETDQKVLARLRGHASDLTIAFVDANADADARPPAVVQPPAFTDADALAAGAHADAVVWFSHARCGAGAAPSTATMTADELIVHIAQTKTRSVLVRAVGRLSCGATGEESATFEAAAIVVRAALLAVSEGGTIGVVPAAPGSAPSTAAPAAWQPRLVVGGLWALDGLSAHGAPGLQARLGWGGEHLAVEAGILATVPTDITDQYATLTLSRAALTVGGAARQALGGRWFVGAGLHAGVVLQMRTTTPRQPGVTADPASRLASVMVSPEGRLGLAIPAVPGLSASVALAADYIPHIPVITYTRDNVVESQRRPWVLQPRASINIELSSP